jgi:hypothetical protein
MATKYFFDNKEITIPGAYSTIKSGIKNPALALAFGNTLVIDTGSGKFFGGGAGIAGTLKTGKDSHYTFDNSRDFRNFIRGGMWWLLAGPLFSPGGGATAGISSLTYIRAKTTVAAEIVIPFGLPSGGVNDGSTTVQVRDEGYVGNGVLGDEVRATSVITVTAAGADGDIISITFQGETLGTYTKVTADTIATVVAGLAASVNALGISEVLTSNATTLTIRAPRGKAASANTLSPTVVVTGTVAGSAAAFAGGVEGTILTRGYGAKVIAGVLDTAKFIVQFWRGSFKGLDSDISSLTPAPYDGVSELSTKPELVVQSPEIANVTQLVAWMNDISGAGFTFNQFFRLKTSVIAATDIILSADITALPIKATGGTESASGANLTAVLDSISDLFFDFILLDDTGDNARSTDNLAILDWVNNTAKIKPDLYIASGKTISKWNSGSTSSVSMAIAYNSQYATIVHGGAKVTDVGGRAMKEYDSIYKAAVILGREAGLEPQIPLTFKSIGIQGELHPLNDKEVKIGLNSGVLMTRADGTSFEVIKGVNSLQNNQYLVNPDGTTASKQLARIVRQLNKEIVINAKAQLLKKPNGSNRNTVSPDDVKEWVKGYLQSKVATDQVDNLILSFQSVEVSVTGDAYSITYAFVPNFEVSFLFFTGTIIDPNV